MYSAIIPVLNSSENLMLLFQKLKDVFTQLTDSFEFIFIDDGSSDDSWSQLKSIKEQLPEKVKIIRLSRNYGQHNATLCGIKYAQGDFVITIDDDLEFDPEDILLLINAQKEQDADVVYGINKNKKTNLLRRIMTSVFRKIQWIATHEYQQGSSFRLLKNKVAKAIVKNSREFSFIDEFIGWYTNKIVTIPVVCNQPMVKSRYQNSGLANMTKNLIVISSTIPLKIVTFIGLIMMIFNFLLGIFIIIRKLLFAIDVKGFTTIVVAILFSSGVIIFSIGIVAEYIGNILKINYDKPAYFEEEVL